MFDCGAENVTTDIFKKAIKQGVKATQKIINGIEQLCKKCGKTKRLIPEGESLDPIIASLLQRY